MRKQSYKKRIFKGRLINLYLRREILPNGCKVDLEMVEHPGAVLIVPFLSKDKLVLIRQYRPIVDSYIWEFPAGTLHKNESPLTCAKRELIEEIGYRAKAWKRIGHIYPTPGYTNERIHIYIARGLKKTAAGAKADEIITPTIFTKRDISRLLRAKKIVDSKTITALKLIEVY